MKLIFVIHIFFVHKLIMALLVFVFFIGNIAVKLHFSKCLVFACVINSVCVLRLFYYMIGTFGIVKILN